MALRAHRTGVVRTTRNRQPDFVRKAGPHVKQTRYEPEICPECGGLGRAMYPNHSILGASHVMRTCRECLGEGEI